MLNRKSSILIIVVVLIFGIGGGLLNLYFVKKELNRKVVVENTNIEVSGEAIVFGEALKYLLGDESSIHDKEIYVDTDFLKQFSKNEQDYILNAASKTPFTAKEGSKSAVTGGVLIRGDGLKVDLFGGIIVEVHSYVSPLAGEYLTLKIKLKDGKAKVTKVLQVGIS